MNKQGTLKGLAIIGGLTAAALTVAFIATDARVNERIYRPHAPTLHVAAATPCADVDLVGTFRGVQYSLSVDRELNKVPLAVACTVPVGPEDVGKDFPATFEVGKATGKAGVMAVTLQPGRIVYYDVDAAREP